MCGGAWHKLSIKVRLSFIQQRKKFTIISKSISISSRSSLSRYSLEMVDETHALPVIKFSDFSELFILIGGIVSFDLLTY